MRKQTRLIAYLFGMAIAGLTILGAFGTGEAAIIIAVMNPAFMFMSAISATYMGTKIAEKWKQPPQ